MEEPIVNENNLNLNEKLFYPPPNYEINLNNNPPENDHYYVDKTIMNNINDNNKTLKSQIIIKTDFNTFKIIVSFRAKALSIWFFILGVISVILIYFFMDEKLIKKLIFMAIQFVLMFIIGFCFGRTYHTYFLILESNSLIINKIALLRKKTFSYYMGELDKAGIIFQDLSNSEVHKYYYSLFLFKKTGEMEKIVDIISLEENVDLKGVKYFIDAINNHIRNNMN